MSGDINHKGTKNLSALSALCALCVFVVLCFGQAENTDSNKAERLLLGKYSEEQVIKTLYPNYNSKTKATGTKSSEGKDIYAVYSQVKEWKYKRGTIVAILVTLPGPEEKEPDPDWWRYLQPDYPPVDIAVLKESDGDLSIIAYSSVELLDEVPTLTERIADDFLTFDFAPYRITDSEYAIGVRLYANILHVGYKSGDTNLHLYRILGDKLSEVLSIGINSWVEEDDGKRRNEKSYNAIIVISNKKTKGFYNIFVKSSTKEEFYGKDDRLVRKSARHKTEIYEWDGNHYIKTSAAAK